ncbi:MAG TPA: polysaccharide deacetylase family protein [Chitinophagaceae bacterium]|nr:polysaccharide deacetylase family protein [Chitinophagaceae bacterium]
METSSTDEPEPKSAGFFLRLVSFAFILIAFFACENRKWQKPEHPVAVKDSAVIKQTEKQRQDSLKKISITKMKIYLTFDDGPNKGTRNVLQVVEEEKAPATFFVVGVHVYDSPEQLQTWQLLQADSSIELCNHSYSHARNRYASFYSNPSAVVADFQRSQQALQFNNTIARMPGRNAWRIDSINHTDIAESSEAIDSLHAAGFPVMGWDIEWMFDHKTLAPDTDTALLLRRIHNMLEAGKTRTPGHLVLLAHDQAFQSADAVTMLRLVLQSLKNNPEYELVLASTYPGVQ